MRLILCESVDGFESLEHRLSCALAIQDVFEIGWMRVHDEFSEEPVVGFQLGRFGDRQYFWSLELAWDTAGRPMTRRL